MSRTIDVTTSFLATAAELGRGLAIRRARKRPEQNLILYDMEGCPYCRIVREVLTEMDCDVLIYPCPKGGNRYREEVMRLGGKMQFPFLVDPNTGTQMYESVDIIGYLIETYGDGASPKRSVIRSLHTVTSMWASGARMLAGTQARPSHPPEKPLELFSFECSPYARLVRERLCELEIAYLVRNVGRDQWQDYLLPFMRKRLVADYQPTQRNRKWLVERTGRVSVPYLVDPNTGAEMYESAGILSYIDQTYGAGDAALAV